MENDFTLHPKLAEDCAQVKDLDLCKVLLMNDNRFPWLILVPQRANLRDFHEIASDDRDDLFNEIDLCSRVLANLPNITKINVAALGNQVPQLHVHVIGRSIDDEAWPGPVWGVGSAEPYTKDVLDRTIGYVLENLVH